MKMKMTVSAKSINDLVRTLWAYDREPVKALKIFRSAFPVVPVHEAVGVCCGELRLVDGVSRWTIYLKKDGIPREGRFYG
jgi:hypothetical protein